MIIYMALTEMHYPQKLSLIYLKDIIAGFADVRRLSFD